jgi:hypothetical protein
MPIDPQDIVLVQDSREQLPYGLLFQTPYVVRTCLWRMQENS